MSNLSVIERNGALVIDSRLIAQDLGIEHKNLLGTIDRYLDRIQSFGIIAFETRKSERGKPERFAYLNEDQATFVMTLSRNTDRVVQCKVDLVKAFSQAKQVIQESIPSQPPQTPLLPSLQDRITLLQQTIECGARHLGWDARDLLFWRDQLKNAAVAMTQPLLPAASGDPEQRMELPISDRALQLGYRPTQNQLLSIGQLAARMYRKTKGYTPPKREQWVSGTTRLVNVYTPNDAAILDEAIQTVMREAN